METAGIEPASYSVLDIASTCLVALFALEREYPDDGVLAF